MSDCMWKEGYLVCVNFDAHTREGCRKEFKYVRLDCRESIMILPCLRSGSGEERVLEGGQVASHELFSWPEKTPQSLLLITGCRAEPDCCWGGEHTLRGSCKTGPTGPVVIQWVLNFIATWQAKCRHRRRQVGSKGAVLLTLLFKGRRKGSRESKCWEGAGWVYLLNVRLLGIGGCYRSSFSWQWGRRAIQLLKDSAGVHCCDNCLERNDRKPGVEFKWLNPTDLLCWQHLLYSPVFHEAVFKTSFLLYYQTAIIDRCLLTQDLWLKKSFGDSIIKNSIYGIFWLQHSVSKPLGSWITVASQIISNKFIWLH